MNKKYYFDILVPKQEHIYSDAILEMPRIVAKIFSSPHLGGRPPHYAEPGPVKSLDVSRVMPILS